MSLVPRRFSRAPHDSPDGEREHPLRVCFFTERQVGVNSVAAVLQRAVDTRPDLDVTWCDVTYHQAGGRIERLPAPGGAKAALRALRQIGQALAKGPFDALFFLTQNPAVLRQDAVARTPTCLWTDVTPLQFDELASAYSHQVESSRTVAHIKRALVARTFQKARRCLGYSEWVRRSMVTDYGVAVESTGVMRPAIDASHWVAPERDTSASRPLRLAFIGGHFERKGGKLLLDVFRSRLRGRCELTIATRDPVPEEPGVRVLRDLSAGSEGLRALLRDADAFILPTLADCHSIASLEAMAAGLPVVLARIGAGPDIVDDGRSGFLVEPGRTEPLAEAIEALVSDRARTRAMGQYGRAMVLERFDMPVLARRVAAELHAAVAGTQRPPMAGAALSRS